MRLTEPRVPTNLVFEPEGCVSVRIEIEGEFAVYELLSFVMPVVNYSMYLG